MSNYANVSDIQDLKRALTASEQNRAQEMIPLVCSLIRFEAKKTGRDFDKMIFESDLVPVIDSFIGDGDKTSFTLSNVPQGNVVVTVGGEDVAPESYTLTGTTLAFTEAPTSEVLAMYDYRALAEVARAVVCDVVMRELNTPGNQLPATSYSESAGSVSQSYTLPNSSGSIKLWPSDLKALGLKRQKISSLNLMKERR